MKFNKNAKVRASFIGKKLCLLIIFTIIISTLFTCFSSAHSTDGAENSETRVASRFYEIFLSGKREKSSEEIYLIPGGDAFGIKIKGTGISVVRIPDNSSTPLKVGDRIKRLGAYEVEMLSEVKEALNASGGQEISAVIERDGRLINLTLTPTRCGIDYSLGVLLEDSASGIGTITYIDPETGAFGGLGHGICSPDGKDVLPMRFGKSTGVILGGASRGERGKPGELRGVLTEEITGDIYGNTPSGVFGKLSAITLSKYSKRTALPIAKKSEVSEGEAEIITTVKNGKTDSYTIRIEDIDYNSDGSKSFKISVCDEALVALSGGIVRGMSGSPIIQNGKLVGAVTHVLVANPTEGYGIFIENMLSAAQNKVIPKVA